MIKHYTLVSQLLFDDRVFFQQNLSAHMSVYCLFIGHGTAHTVLHAMRLLCSYYHTLEGLSMFSDHDTLYTAQNEALNPGDKEVNMQSNQEEVCYPTHSMQVCGPIPK